MTPEQFAEWCISVQRVDEYGEHQVTTYEVIDKASTNPGHCIGSFNDESQANELRDEQRALRAKQFQIGGA